jgi:2'-5' RNA ligase superfamily
VNDGIRYGVYLRPDPATCWAVTQLTGAVRAQYGFVSAGAFPPHATLVGSQHLPVPEPVIVEAVATALAGRTAFPVYNGGIRGLGDGFAYDVHHLTDGVTPNAELVALAAAVDQAVAPLRVPVRHHRPVNYEPDTFRGHVSLASHDLIDRRDLAEEVVDYLRAVPVDPPPRFSGDTVALYATASADWSGRWWRTLSWEHLHTWRLPADTEP